MGGANPAGGLGSAFWNSRHPGCRLPDVCSSPPAYTGPARLGDLPPVLINAVVVGIELTLVYGGLPWYFNMLGVAAGQLAACTVCGLLLFAMLERSGAARVLFSAQTGRAAL